MTTNEAIKILKLRNERYAKKHGINDYVRETENIINALIEGVNQENTVGKRNPDKESFPFAPAEFSGYDSPVRNIIPSVTWEVADAYQCIVEHPQLKENTGLLRAIADKAERNQFKAEYFPYCTFSGVFSKRDANHLVKHSNMMVLDFDHVGADEDISGLKCRLLKDKYFETLLMFRSPSGDGLKWLVNIDVTRYDHRTWFDGIYHYIRQTYGLEIDKSGSDVARACFLCHDPQAFIHPTLYRHAV